MHIAGWIFLTLLVILLVIWVVHGRGQHEFLGLRPLIPGETGVRYLGYSEPSDGEASYFAAARSPRPGVTVAADPPNPEIMSPGEPEDSGEATLDTSEEAQAERTNEDAISLSTPRPMRGGTATSRGEELCRQILEEIYGLPFPTVRPNFLKNPETGKNLEIDGYCHELRLGFEYNGSQHYSYPNTYHKSTEEFLRQVRRDHHKYRLCKRLGIHLIVVPHTVPVGQMREFILSQLPRTPFSASSRSDKPSESPDDLWSAPGLPSEEFARRKNSADTGSGMGSGTGDKMF